MTGIARRGAAFSVALVAAITATPATARASAPGDALTESSSPASIVRTGAGFADIQEGRGCTASVETTSTGESATRVKCQHAKYGYVSLEFFFRVPSEAISPAVDASITTIDASGGAGQEAEIYRVRRGFKVFVALGGGKGEWLINNVTLDYEVPTTFDTRPCVTDGEWARISVFDGGVGGSLSQVASVFDTDGEQLFLSPSYDGFRYQIRSYRRCGSEKVRKVTFHLHDKGGWHSYWG